MFLLPFLKYLKPFKTRLVIALICMFGTGFFGTYSVFLVKPALDIIFDEVKLEKRIRDVEEKAVSHEAKLKKYLSSENAFVRFEGRIKQLYYPLEREVKENVIKLYRYADHNRTKCLRLIAAFLVIAALIKGVFEYGFRYNLSYTLYSVVIQMKSDIFRHIMGQDMRFFTTKSVGFLMSRITSDVIAIRGILDMLIKNGMLESIRLVFIVSALLVMSVKMTTFVFLGVLPVAGLLAYFAFLIKKVTRKQKRKQDVLSGVMNESLGNVRLVKSFTTEDLECRKFDVHNTKLFLYEMQRRVAKFAASPIMELLGSIGLGLILLAAGKVVIRDKVMEPSEFMVYLGLLSMFYTPLKHLARVNVSWQQGTVSAQRISEILALRPTVTDPDGSLTPVTLERVEHGLSVRNVTFRYKDKVILENISMEIPRGRTTAIVGRSGSGKSTLANLLLRLYDPDDGCILLDGHDLRHFRLKDLRKHYGMVTQETLLFNDTIANNITYGSNDANSDRVVDAARGAHAHDFIMALDGGKDYNSPVGPSGGQLSGGQRQRIAVARAFYRDPEILILDEATSSLDTQSEAAVQEALEQLMKNRTVVVISHRLSTIRNADHIIVLEDGRLVEQGTHSDLLALGGYYATLCKHGEIAQS